MDPTMFVAAPPQARAAALAAPRPGAEYLQAAVSLPRTSTGKMGRHLFVRPRGDRAWPPLLGTAAFLVGTARLARRSRRRRVATAASPKEGEPQLLTRRSLLPAALAAAAAPEAATALLPPGTASDFNYPEWTALPLAPYARRRTVLSEVVPGQVWTLDQIFGTFYVHVPIRSTVLKVAGGLLVYAPVAATKECLQQVKSLEAIHGPVRWIILTSKAVEHKVLAAPFAQRFPAAQFFIAPGQYSVPVDVSLSVLGFPKYETLSTEPSELSKLPWAADCETAVLDLGTFGEVALLHKASQTLVITDTLVSIPEEPPVLLSQDAEYSKALAYHARDSATEPVSALPPTLEIQKKGWERIALFATFFNPGGLAEGEVLVPETGAKRPWKWQAGWEASFKRLRDGGKPFVAPIIRELILQQKPEKALEYAERIVKWNFKRAVPAHFASPLNIGQLQVREAFSFLLAPPAPGKPASGPDYCSEDLAFLKDLQRQAVPAGRPVRPTSSCGFKPRAA